MPKVYFKGQAGQAMDVLESDLGYWSSMGWTTGVESKSTEPDLSQIGPASKPADQQVQTSVAPVGTPRPQAAPPGTVDLSRIGPASQPVQSPVAPSVTVYYNGDPNQSQHIMQSDLPHWQSQGWTTEQKAPPPPPPPVQPPPESPPPGEKPPPSGGDAGGGNVTNGGGVTTPPPSGTSTGTGVMATLVDPTTGRKVQVESGSAEAQSYFDQGYLLERPGGQLNPYSPDSEEYRLWEQEFGGLQMPENQATMVNPETGERVSVAVGSQQAKEYFGQGYVLETAGMRGAAVGGAAAPSPTAGRADYGTNPHPAGTPEYQQWEQQYGSGSTAAPVEPTPSAEGSVKTGTQQAAEAGETDFMARVSQVLARYGIAPPDQTRDPINQAISAYRKVYQELGLTGIKAQFEEVQGEYAKLMEKKDDEIAKIRDNPWMNENQKRDRIKNIERKYEDRTRNFLNQMSMYQNLYESGQREAQFVMGQISAVEQRQQTYSDIMLKAAIEQVENEFATTEVTDDIREYLYAVETGFEGDFVDYKNAVAGRMTGTGNLSALAMSVIQDPQILTQLTPSIKSEVLSELASNGFDIGEAVRLYGDLTEQQRFFVDKYTTEFNNLQAVKNYQVVAEGNDFVQSIIGKGGEITSADDQGLIYAFAKAMDPNSVVREGEYATVQKYAQSWASKFGFDVARIFSNTPFLTDEARRNMASTIQTKFDSAQRSYDSLYSQYGNRIDTALGTEGTGASYLIDYSAAFREGGVGGVSRTNTFTDPTTNETVTVPTATDQGQAIEIAADQWTRAQAAGIPREMFDLMANAPTVDDVRFEQWLRAKERAAGIESPKAEAPAGGGEITSVSIGGRNVTVSSEIADRLAKADAEMFAATGKHLEVNQSYRTKEQQAELYRRSQAGEIGRAAPPGYSFHEKGLAVDVTNWREAEPYLRRYGLSNELADDRGHFSFGEFT